MKIVKAGLVLLASAVCCSAFAAAEVGAKAPEKAAMAMEYCYKGHGDQMFTESTAKAAKKACHADAKKNGVKGKKVCKKVACKK